MSPLSTSLSANPSRNISVRLSSRNDFYQYDTHLNRRVNQFLPFSGNFPRLTYFSANLNLRLRGKSKKTGRSGQFGSDETEQSESLGKAEGDIIDGKIETVAQSLNSIGIALSDFIVSESYCQMLCMALGSDPFFNNTVNKLYSSDDFSKAFRMVQSDPSFLSAAT
jgi:hypothetical protein